MDELAALSDAARVNRCKAGDCSQALPLCNAGHGHNVGGVDLAGVCRYGPPMARGSAAPLLQGGRKRPTGDYLVASTHAAKVLASASLTCGLAGIGI